MSGYSYGYGTTSAAYTAQPAQQYSNGVYAAAATPAYGYATSQQPARVVPAGYAPVTYSSTAYTAVSAAPATVQGGFGYFQRAADPSAVYTNQKTSTYGTAAVSAYGYSATAPKVVVGSAGYTPATLAATPTYNSYAAKTSAKPAASSNLKTVTPDAGHQNAYEKVVYNAATSFLTQQSQQTKAPWSKSQKPQFKLANQRPGLGANRGPPKPQQLHYCEVCKISCAGPQTYKEHLEGQKHKKKAAAAATTKTEENKKLPAGTYKCELCDVTCTGKDAFAAHLKGANHIKVLKLHQKLGKPIPEIKMPEIKPAAKKATVVKTAAPKMNFVGGSKLLSSVGGGLKEESTNSVAPTALAGDGAEEEDVEPVGEDLVVEDKSEAGKVIGYKCNLCDCKFNDDSAKNAHVKGRRHRWNYKKKVDPKLVVLLPKSSRVGGRRGLGRSGRGNDKESLWRQRQQEQLKWEQELHSREAELRRWEHGDFTCRVGEDRYWTRPDRHHMHELEYYEWERKNRYMDPPKPLFGPRGAVDGPLLGPDDKLVVARHNLIYPGPEELAAVQSIVGVTEKALKLVSDNLAEEGEKSSDAEKGTTPADTPVDTNEKKAPVPLIASADRVLKGVMRVGVLAKGLLLKGHLNLDLVVLCAEKPTYTLLKKVGKLFPEKLKEVTEEKYNMSISVVQCAIIVTSTKDPKTTVKVTLTSPVMRDGSDQTEEEKKASEKSATKADPKDVLDKDKCLQALTALRHAKWFQARANQLQSCVEIIRVFRDICNRVDAFKPLNDWAIELLCEKAIASYPVPLGPGQAFRRVIECLASGVLLKGGAGLLDPCEKESTDVAAKLTDQEREDLTAAAQHAVRLQAFRQLHKILEVEPLKPVPLATKTAKRPADDAVAAGEAKVAKTESKA